MGDPKQQSKKNWKPKKKKNGVECGTPNIYSQSLNILMLGSILYSFPSWMEFSHFNFINGPVLFFFFFFLIFSNTEAPSAYPRILLLREVKLDRGFYSLHLYWTDQTIVFILITQFLLRKKSIVTLKLAAWPLSFFGDGWWKNYIYLLRLWRL